MAVRVNKGCPTSIFNPLGIAYSEKFPNTVWMKKGCLKRVRQPFFASDFPPVGSAAAYGSSPRVRDSASALFRPDAAFAPRRPLFSVYGGRIGAWLPTDWTGNIPKTDDCSVCASCLPLSRFANGNCDAILALSDIFFRYGIAGVSGIRPARCGHRDRVRGYGHPVGTSGIRHSRAESSRQRQDTCRDDRLYRKMHLRASGRHVRCEHRICRI